MYVNNRIKASILTVIILITVLLISQYNTYSYINTKLSELETRQDEFDERLSLSETSFRSYRIEISGFASRLLNVENDIDSLKIRVRNATSNHNGLPITSNDRSYVGKLVVPDAGIDLPLYSGWAQDITDRQNSANYYTYSQLNHNNMIIADHNNQEFSKLFDVKVGTVGYIEFKDGCVENIKCVKVLDGYNKLSTITDTNNISVIDAEDYLMYTCKNGWRNILICLWSIV